jgi:hypothetical protein
VLRILCSAEARSGQHEELLEVFLDLHTTSLAWSQALGLGLGEQQPAPGATTASTSTTSSTPSDGGITKPLLTWQHRLFSKNADNRLLAKIWRALGFEETTVAPGRPAGDDEGKENSADVDWDCSDVETVLLAGLGYVWPFEAPSLGRGLGRLTHVVKWLRQAERFLQRVPPQHVSFCVYV